MAANCSNCGAELSFLQKVRGLQLCASCAASGKTARKEAQQRYHLLVEETVANPDRLAALREQLPTVRAETGLSDREVRQLHENAFVTYLEKALEDDHLTEEEESLMGQLSDVLGITQHDFETDFRGYLFRLVIARVNNGRLPVLPSPRIILKKAEVAHAEMAADLLKEVVHREYRGGYSGVSFRVVKGVRFHTGGFRGKSVVVGTSLQTEDSGVLTVTSQRAVFAGQRASIEMPYSKLLTLNVFNDGIQFHLSNRKKAPLFKLENGQVIAAMVNAAVQDYAS
ncbi:MAG: hypothetical protein HYY03_01895 [Chloroflexi bacterium]|nr:hypothetical protein [Chloroflexota bacterium]